MLMKMPPSARLGFAPRSQIHSRKWASAGRFGWEIAYYIGLEAPPRVQTRKGLTSMMMSGQGSASKPAAVAGEESCEIPVRLIQDLFIQQALDSPDNLALVSSSRNFTYGDLLRLSTAWGRELRRLGARPNTAVAILMQKGWEQVVAALSILQSGAAYLPIDSHLPVERIHYLLRNSEASIVLTQSFADRSLQLPEGLHRIAIDTDIPQAEGGAPLGPVQSPDDLAYVLYTSGSTGTPKGVMIAHRGLVNCIVDTNRTFDIGPNDRVLAVSALHHDMSVFDIFSTLAAGGTIVVPDAAGARAPDHWVELIDRHQVTVWNSVPGFMEMLLEYAQGQNLRLPGRLRLAFLGGDWIPVSAPARIQRHFGDVQVVSVGGPTETTLWNIWYPIQRVDPSWQSIPYGHAIANTRYYVLDENLQECPPGDPGELCCSGVGLMKGYWRDEEKTRSKLAILPANGECICRTGDRGRLREDGEIEFLGRLDSQVKINGQRIELGEIEATLTQHPAIRRAAVRVIQTGETRWLCSYFTSESASPPAAGELRRFLAERLPDYMVPCTFQHLAAMPLNANGKVDRQALPDPATQCAAERSKTNPVEPADGFEKTISDVWSSALQLTQVGPEDNFFDLGGTSLLLVRVHSELQRQLNRQIPITDLFEFPTVRALRKHLEGQAPALPISAIEERAMKQKLAMAQRRSGRR